MRLGRGRLLESAQQSRQTFEATDPHGDKYIRDADGRYTFCGRSDDMFKVFRHLGFAVRGESALITLPAVLESRRRARSRSGRILKPKASWCCERTRTRRPS